MNAERDRSEAAAARGIRLRFWAWSGVLTALLGVFVGVVLPQLKVETDIVALLPQNQADAQANRAVEQFSQRLAQKMIFLVGAAELDAAKTAASQFAATLRDSGAFAQVDLEVSARMSELLTLYRAHRGVLLSNRHAHMLRAGQDQALLQEALRAAFTPAGLARPLSLAEDPLGLAADYLQQQAPALGAAQLDGSMLVVIDEARSHVLITAELAGSPFASATQEAAMAAIAAGRERVASQAEVLVSGTVQHADAITRRAQAELASFGTIEVIAVMALLLAIFGALRPLGLGAMTMGLAFTAGMTATHLLFSEVHVLALVFGSSLIGGVIDYSIHFFADRFRGDASWTPAEAYGHVGGAILLGLITTLLSYVVLVFVPFPGLRQIAVFCIAGLVVGCGTVLCAYPVLYKASASGSLGPRLGSLLMRRFRQWSWTPLRTTVALALLAFAIAGLAKVSLQDDVRALQSSPAELAATEQRVSSLLQSALESRYFLVRGASEQALLETEERLAASLDALVDAGKLSTYSAVTRSLPSYRRQRETQSLLAARVLGAQGLQAQAWAALGFDAAAIAKRTVASTYPDALLSPAEWLKSPAAESYGSLWLGAVSGQFASIVSLGGIKDLAALKDVAAQIEGVSLVDRIAAVSEVLRSYREALTGLLFAVYLAAGIVLARKFGWREAPGLLLPSALASLVTLGLFGWCGVPVNLFTMLALWLVLGLGVDYGIFLRHGCTALGTAVLSVTLSATTTLLAFGLLAFSATPFIRSIGLSLLCAISLSWLFAMLSCLTMGTMRGTQYD